MANILTGYGKPSVLLPGLKGQIYIDKLTGDEYECKGERGFIRVDGDDQDNQFNWVLKKKEEPFYENVLTSVPCNEGGIWYKVSDKIPTGDVSIGTKCTLFINGGGEYGELNIVETDYYSTGESGELTVIVVLKDNTKIPESNAVFPQKGTYFLYAPGLPFTITGFSLGKTNVPEITWDGQTTKLKKLDEKFIPSRIIGIINSDLTFTADPSFDPSTMSVFDALASGKDLLYKTLESDEDTLKCIAWRECTGSIGFYDILDGRVYKLIWTVLTDGTVSIENTSVVS